VKIPVTVLIALLVWTGGCIGPGVAAAGTEDGSAGARILPGLYLSNVKAVGINDTSAWIDWETNYESDSAVEYGPDASYGSSVNDSSLVTSHSVRLGNMTGSTEYHFRVLSRQHPADVPACSDDYRFFTAAPQDETPPVISNMHIEGITESAATILWETDEPADASVEYGLNTSYDLTCSTMEYSLQHTLLLTNLSADTVYHIRARSLDPNGNTVQGPDVTFRTKKAGPPPDTAMPVIFGIQIGNITDTGAVVLWHTDESANSTLDYGRDQNYGKRIEDPVYYPVHSLVLEGLAPSTTYHLVIGSTDVFGNGPNVSADFNFTTLPHTEPPVIILTYPANGSAHVNATIAVGGKAWDKFTISGVEFSANLGTWTEVSGLDNWSFNLTLRTGNNTITVRATDRYGNIGTAMLVLYLWDSDPGRAIPIATQHDGQTVRTDKLRIVSGSVNSSTPIRTFDVTVNGIPVTVEQSGNNWSVRDVELKEGENIIEVHATDDWGNDISRKISVKYDKAKTDPGFEAMFLVAAIVVGLAILKRRRR